MDNVKLFGRKLTEDDFGYCRICNEHLLRSELESQTNIFFENPVDVCLPCADKLDYEISLTEEMDEAELSAYIKKRREELGEA